MTTIADQLQSLTPSAKLEFFVVDLSMLVDRSGTPGGVENFHNGTNELRGSVVWQGISYQFIPIQVSGFELNAEGPRPRPLLEVGDVYGVLGALVRQYGDLAGAHFIRKQTHARFLDAANFAAGNPSADPTAQYDDELWIFDRVRARDGTQVAWELVSPMDLEDLMLPGRQVRNRLCGSIYRSGECGYGGGPVAMADDTPTTDPALDDCSRYASGCKLRFGESAELPIDFFPGAGVVRQM